MKIDGKTLIAWGVSPGKHMGGLIKAAQAAFETGGEQAAQAVVFDAIAAMQRAEESRVELRKADPAPFKTFLDPGVDGTPDEWVNLGAVERDMRLLMQCPTVTRGAIMPDACPAGVISVGGVVETVNAIHPGFHSADICCSVMATVFDDDVDQKALLDAAHSITHFGGGGRPRGKQIKPSKTVLDRFEANYFLRDLVSDAIEHFATQGDGNHFLFVGRLRSTGQVALVTHHGSRRPGAQLYKRGMKVAREHTARLARGIPDGMAWIEAMSSDGQEYWDALQQIRKWTRESHIVIHDTASAVASARTRDRFWNEHNFVFMRDDKFLHAKGATPAYANFSDGDPLASSGRVLIPMNMGEPIIVATGLDNLDALGFAPHGAGRNVSRSAFMRASPDQGKAELQALKDRGLDIRFWFDTPDATELPSAYKNPTSVTDQMERFGLAKAIDWIEPYGCIMAGNWERRA